MSKQQTDAQKNPHSDRWADRWGVIGLAIDLLMMVIGFMSLSLLVFDSMWVVPELRSLMGWIVPPQWLDAYAPVHEHFFRIDGIFVSIFLTEFLVGWGLALWNRRYNHWLAYPVFHWYDIIGCIPAAGLRWLRVLRIFGILVRLQHLELIDYRTWPPYRWFMRFYDIIMEEISDRVVIQILSGAQEEIGASRSIERKVLERVVHPRQASITSAMRRRVVHITEKSYTSARDDIQVFVKNSVSEAVRANREIKRIDRIPFVGGVASGMLDEAITDIVCRVVDELAGKVSGDEFEMLFTDLVSGVIEGLTETSESETDQLSDAIVDIIEVMKEQVAQRRWLEPTPPG